MRLARPIAAAVTIGLWLFAPSAFAAEQASAIPALPPRASAEDVGMSSERLSRIGTTLKADIDAGRIPGAVIAIVRRGKLVMLDAYGWRDKDAGLPMTTDTIFDIASMTKPMTTVGALMLYEHGKIAMDEPLSKYFPKFAASRVAARDAAGDPVTRDGPGRPADLDPRSLPAYVWFDLRWARDDANP